MSYIESILDPDEKGKYKEMLDTFFILLLSDQTFFIETDEKGIEYESVSWMYSYKTFYEDINYGTRKYPQGSISANRLLYSALKNYCLPLSDSQGFLRYVKTRLDNFLRLRCDNVSSALPSYMYGSSFEIRDNLGLGAEGKIREIPYKVNFRHTANALSILLSESDILSTSILNSYASMLENFEKLLSTESKEKDQHITLASLLNVMHSFSEKFKDHELSAKSHELINICRERLLSKHCLEEEYNGYYRWNLISENFRKYDYYLTFFTFNQYPYILEDTKAQRILENIIENNRIQYKSLDSIGLSPLDYLTKDEIKPDFGITVSLVYLLQLCIDNKIGGAEWIKYCKGKIRPFLKFCLSNFNNSVVHQITMLESAAKSLLLPNIELSIERYTKNMQVVDSIRQNIPHKLEAFESINIEDGTPHHKFVLDFIKRWDIESPEELSVEYDKIDKIAYVLYNGTRLIYPVLTAIAQSYYI